MHPCPKCGHQSQDERSDVDQPEYSDDGDVMDEALADLEAQLDEQAAGKLPKKDADVTIAISTGKKKAPAMPFESEEDEDEEV
jgi:hypothetical protein